MTPQLKLLLNENRITEDDLVGSAFFDGECYILFFHETDLTLARTDLEKHLFERVDLGQRRDIIIQQILDHL